MTRNELAARYAGSLLGAGWIILLPALILGIHAAVYLLILRVQVAGLTAAEYVLYIFSGLVPFLMTAEALSVGVSSVVANKLVLSNTVFPIDLVPPKAVLVSQGTMVVGLAVVTLGSIVTRRLSWTVLLAPLVWALAVLALLGLTWILSLINIVFRDLQTLINAALMMLFVASPIAYTPEMVPPQMRLIVTLNPLAYFIIAFQKILILGEVPGVAQSAVLVVLSVGLFVLGGWFFPRAKRVVIDYV